jgi:hypothetical protein
MVFLGKDQQGWGQEDKEQNTPQWVLGEGMKEGRNKRKETSGKLLKGGRRKAAL